MAVNVSQFQACETYALEATLLATAGNDRPLLAWIKGTQSFGAYYQHRYQDAVALARAGLRLAGADSQRVRLLSNGLARAAGKLGDHATVERAIDEALTLVPMEDATRDLPAMTSCIDLAPYGWARTAANAATAYLSAGHYARVIGLTSQLNSIVAASDSDWSRSLVSLDEATALTRGRQADLDHAASIGMRALATSAHKPIASVRSRAADLAADLNRHGPRQTSRDFTAALLAWGRPSTPS